MRRMLLPLVAVGGSLTPGCWGPSSEPSPVSEAPEGPRGTLVVGTTADVGNLHPAVYETASDAALMPHVYLPTTRFDFDCGLVHKPALATRWSWAEGGRTLTLNLRDDVTWSDGEPVTAHDLVHTYQTVRDPEVSSPRLATVQHLVDDSPNALHDHTVRFTFTHAYDRTTQLAHASLFPTPTHVFADVDPLALRGHPASHMPPSSGPWSLTRHERNTRFVLEPNPAYSGPDAFKPNLRRVVFRVIPEYATRLIELKNGGIDMMEGLHIDDLATLRQEHPNLRITSRGYRTSDYIGWNLANPLFEERDVRRALTLALDIDGMIAKLLTSGDGTRHAKRMVSTFSPELCSAHASDIKPLPYDLGRARALLARHGWQDTDGDGVLDKDGRPFRFTLKTNTGNQRRAEAAVLIQAQLKRVGIDVQISKQDTHALYSDLRQRDFEAALAGWSASLFIDPSSIWGADKPEQRNPFNYVGYHSPEAESLMAKGLAEPDPAAATPTWHALQRVIYDDQPYTFLWWREELVAIDDRFENTRVHAGSLLADLHRWSVPPDQVRYPH